MMGDTSPGWRKSRKRSVPDDHVSFIDFGEEDGSEGDGPDPVVGFFQADVMLFQGIGDEEQFVFDPEGTGVGNALPR